MNESTQKIIELLDAHGPRLHALLARLAARQDVAEDLLQDLFLRLLRSNTLDQAQNPEAYLVRSAINLAFDWRKSAARTRSSVQPSEDLVAETDKSLDILIETERVEMVLSAMDQLSDLDRELLSLRYLHESSYEWIAQQYETSTHHIRSRCSKALQRLRQIIESESPTNLLRKDH